PARSQSRDRFHSPSASLRPLSPLRPLSFSPSPFPLRPTALTSPVTVPEVRPGETQSSVDLPMHILADEFFEVQARLSIPNRGAWFQRIAAAAGRKRHELLPDDPARFNRGDGIRIE